MQVSRAKQGCLLADMYMYIHDLNVPNMPYPPPSFSSSRFGSRSLKSKGGKRERYDGDTPSLRYSSQTGCMRETESELTLMIIQAEIT